MLLAALASAAAAQDAPTNAGDSTALARDNVVILLDASGSMEDTMSGSDASRMDVAKQALAKVVDQIDARTNVGFLVFSDIPEANGWLYPLGPLDRPRLLDAIDSCRASGATPLGAYLKQAADRLLEARQAQRGYGTYRLLVVTDGEANDPELLGMYLPDVLSRGITIDCIGVDMREEHALAKRVHSYRRGDDPSGLERAVAQALAEVGSTDSTDDATAEQYELAAAFPEETAAEILTSLTTPLSKPIGEGPGATERGEDVFGDDSAEYYGGQDSGGGIAAVIGGLCTCVLVVVVLAAIVAIAVIRALGKKRR
jgi:hypothetical protein